VPNVPYTGVTDVTPSVQQPSDYFTQQATPNDFGAQVGQAVQGLGQAGVQAGEAGLEIATQRQTRVNNIAVDKAYNQFQDQTNASLAGDPNKPGDQGYFGLHGQAAVDARPGIVQSLEDNRQNIKSGLGNQAQELAFEEQSRRLSMNTGQRIDQKYEQEFNNAALLDNRAGQANRERSVAIDPYNEDNFQHQLADSLAKADAASAIQEGANQGTPAGKEVFAYNRAVNSQGIYASRAVALGNLDPAAGLAFMQQNSTQFDARVFHELSKEFRTKTDTAGDNAYVAGLFGQTGAAGGTAGVADAIHAQEHSTATSVSAKGARGEWQVEPATFRQIAQPGENIDIPADNEAVARRYIDGISRQSNVNGDPARIAVGYFSGPGNVAPAGSATPWIEDKNDKPDGTGTSTSAYVAGVLARLNGKGGDGSGVSPRSAALAAPSYPDESAIIQKVITDNPDPDVQARRLSMVKQALGTLRLATETDRRDLTNSLPDLQAAALGGNDITVPEDRIHRLLPPAQAAQWLEHLHVATQAGRVFKGVQWDTPEQVNAAYQDLSSGLGPISTMIRNKGITAPPGTAAPGSDQETPEAYKLRTSILHQFQQQVAARQAALSADPAGYVANNPVVAAKAAAIDPKNPATFEDYANASMATQESLGVAPSDRHVLGASQAAAISKQLMAADPATTDAGAQLDSIAKGYGKSWPQAFGDLVTLGKLPREYQILGSMDAPGQDTARVDFARALQATAKRGGSAQMEADAPPAEMANIKKGLDATIDTFRQTASVPGISGNIGLVSNVRDSVKQLATFYAIQGMDGNAALQKATDGILNEKYDFGSAAGLGTSARVPKGTLPRVEGAASGLVGGLKPEDLMPFRSSGDSGTDKLRQTDALRLVQRNAQWAPTEDDQGLFAYVKLNDGRNVPVKLANGNRLEMRFANLPQGTAAPAVPAASDVSMQ
jgi:hypothetical protein